MAIRTPITFTADEKRKLAGRATKLGLSFSNYVRRLLGLPLLKHGDPRRFKRKAAEADMKKDVADELNGGAK